MTNEHASSDQSAKVGLSGPGRATQRPVDSGEPAVDQADAVAGTVLLLRAMAACARTRFACFVDEQPSALIPAHAREALRGAGDDAVLLVNPTLHYSADGAPPSPVQALGLPLQSFLRGYPLAWVQDTRAGLWTPYWVRGAYAEWLPRFEPGQSPPADLPRPMHDALRTVDILVAPEQDVARREQQQRRFHEARTQFRADSYALVRDLIHPCYLGAMRQYYRHLLAQGTVPAHERGFYRRYALHSELLGSFFHRQLAALVSGVVGAPMKPSYLYFASYQPGDVLPPHLDREQCEITISFLTDYVPEPAATCGWPLRLERHDAPSGTRVPVGVVDLAIGDAVLFKGRELLHSRAALPAGHRSTSLFFHYVPVDYQGALW